MLGSTKSLREKAILSLLSFSGIRNYELCCLRVSDLNTATSSLMIHGTKVGRDRGV
jgi:site-specific recombinase XerD